MWSGRMCILISKRVISRSISGRRSYEDLFIGILLLLHPPSLSSFPLVFLGAMEQTRPFGHMSDFYSVLDTPEYVRTAMDKCTNDSPLITKNVYSLPKHSTAILAVISSPSFPILLLLFHLFPCKTKGEGDSGFGRGG